MATKCTYCFKTAEDIVSDFEYVTDDVIESTLFDVDFGLNIYSQILTDDSTLVVEAIPYANGCMGDQCISISKRKINYCPMCGRKLDENQ